MALGSEQRAPIAYTLLADARMRGGQPDAVVTILKPAYAQRPTDDELGKRLAVAYIFTAAFSEALPILDGYLTRHPTDADVLFAAVLAQYQVARTTGAELTTADRAKLLKYVRSYKGPQEALLAKYLSSLGVNR
jgi:predicted Zn-dependent protease